MELRIPKVDDCAVTGGGDSPAWARAQWQPLARVGNGKATYPTQAKVVYSTTGIYFLVDCEDQRLTCTPLRDFDDLFKEDVVEVFVWTDESQALYFEYEISPLDAELPILVANHNGKFMGWRPWHYEGARRVHHAANVRGGKPAPGATVSGWTVEFFFPYALFQGLGQVPPKPGTRWRANLYRIDYDAKPTSQWAWCPDTGGDFHGFRRFGTIVFA